METRTHFTEHVRMRVRMRILARKMHNVFMCLEAFLMGSDGPTESVCLCYISLAGFIYKVIMTHRRGIPQGFFNIKIVCI